MKRTFTLFCLLTTLTACGGGELLNTQPRPGPGQAVQSPFAYTAANDEVFSRQSGAMPFLTVDFANNKDEEPRVTTIADSLAVLGGNNRPRATTRPAPTTAPATQPLAAGTQPVTVIEVRTDSPLRIVGQQRTDDRITLSSGNDGQLSLQITSGMGIGAATLERTGDRWPATFTVELSYADGRKFNRLEGFTASEVTADGRKVPLRSNIEREQGRAIITIPAFSRAERILVEWVDMYR